MSQVEGDAAEVADGERWLEWVTLDSLVPADRNSKDHELEEIGRSFRRHGYVELIVLDDRTGRVLSGHGRRQRMLDARAAGDPAPWGVRVLDDGTWEAQVVRGYNSPNDAEALACAIALNRVGELGGWNQRGLAEDLRLLKQVTESGLAGTGYTDEEQLTLLAASGVTGEESSSFLADLIDPSHDTGKPGDRGIDGVATSVTLTLTFRTREERDEVVRYLRAAAAEAGLESVGEGLLTVARDAAPATA